MSLKNNFNLTSKTDLSCRIEYTDVFKENVSWLIRQNITKWSLSLEKQLLA